MAIIERKQLTGSTAKINQYAGHEGQLVFDKTTKHLHVLSGTAGNSTKLANVSDIPAPVDISGKADKTYVDTELAKKQAKGDYATNTALTKGLATKLGATAKAVSAGTADSATKATQDANGNVITTTYATKTEVTSGLAEKAPTSHTHTIANINDLQTKLDDLAAKIETTGGLPLGHHYAWPFGTVPANSIQCNGSTYSRTLYADFWQWLQDNSLVKTETEWQSIASQNNGYCSYYSDGDGSTTFRTPKFAPFMQIAIASGNVGNYHKAGLPNITGSVSVSGGEYDLSRITGTLVSNGALTASSHATSGWVGYGEGGGRYWSKLSFSASDSDKTYGRSSTVQPESSEWMICVVAFGVATNIGSADVGNVMSAIAQVQAELPNKLNSTTPIIVDTWKSGSSWYRKWSDGFIEQGGVVISCPTNGSPVSLNIPFSSANYSLVCSANLNSPTSAQSGFAQAKPINASSFTVRIRAGEYNFGESAAWHASGY